MPLNPEQIAAIKAAPDGAQLKVGGQLYTKSGSQLIPAEVPTSGDAEPPGLIGRAIHGTGRAIIEGGKEALGAIPATVGAIAGMPGQIATDVRNLATDPGPTLSEWAKRAGRFAPPALGAAGGGVLGGPLGAVAGGTLGTLAVQAMERGEVPSASDVVRETTASALTGRMGQLAKPALAGTLKAGLGPRSWIPGVKKGVAPELHSLAEPRINALPAPFRATKTAMDQAFTDVHTKYGALPVPMTELQARIADLVAREKAPSPSLQRPDVIADLDALGVEAAQGWTFNTLMANAERLGAKLGSGPDVPKGLARLDMKERASLLEAMHEDVATMSGPAGPEWAKARRLFRRNEAANTLQKIVDSGRNTVSDQYDQVAINRMLQGIKKTELDALRGVRSAKLFTGAFDAGELTEIKGTLRAIARDLPRIQPGKQTQIGSGQRVLLGATAETIAGLTDIHGPIPPWAIGILAPELIAQGLLTRGGRAAVRFAIKMDPTAGPVFQNTLGAFLRTQAHPEVDPSLAPQAPQQPPAQPVPVPQPSPTLAPAPLPNNAVKGMQEDSLGKVLDRWRHASESEKSQMRPILQTRLMRGNLIPQDRQQLIEALRPNSNPEVAPAH